MAHSKSSTLVAGADLEFGTKASMTKQNAGDLKLRQSLWLRRFCYSLAALAFLSFVEFSSYKPTRAQIGQLNEAVVVSMAPSMVPLNGQQGSTRIRIEDVVVFDSGEVLVLMRLHLGTRFPSKNGLKCRFGDRYTSPVALHKTQEGRGAALLCGPPPAELASWDVSSLTIELNQGQQEIIRPHGEQPGIQWSPTNHVVYEAFSTPDDVVVFVHGMNNTRGEDLRLLRCVFNDEIETAVTSQAQEVIRCAHPPGPAFHHPGAKITVKFDGRSLPSVARYIPLDSMLMRKKVHHDVCACTMIYNGAKFLDEWVYYHTHLGVTKFFLYDNNSEDDLEGTISSLNDRSFNVVKHPWPWVKTQEAGFSHCSLLARPECEWMLFIDVDEYFFPNRKYQDGSQLTKFIADAAGTRPVGQIMTFCNNYGPSMLTSSPAQGVTQGYTCRMARPERHKSIVKLDTIARNLSNVIHHFSLQEGYENVKITGGVAVINHYKFQVWDEFKVKFRRRAATYVADWTEDRNHDSKDRVPDLGTRAVKPPDWEKRYCEVWDYGLRNYTRSVFGSYDDSSFHRLRLAWERSL